jgi:hypothetical protein
VCDTLHVPPLKPQPSPLVPLLVSLVAICLAAHNLTALLTAVTSAGPRAMPPPDSTTTPAAGLLGAARSLLSVVVYTPPQVSSLPPAAADVAPDAQLSMSHIAASIAEAGGGGGGVAAVLGGLTGYVAVPLVLGLGLLALVVQNGKHLVNRPQLCPHLAVTVAKPPPSGAARDASKKRM